MKSSQSLFPAMLAFAALLTHARAQLQVSIEFDRTMYVSGEQVIAVITVENQAGKDLVLGGPNNQSWLQMEVRNDHGKLMAPNGGGPKLDPLVVKNFDRVVRKIDMGAFYTIEQSGSYVVEPSVYFTPLSRWISPAKKGVFQVCSPKAAFWERTVALPKGHEHQGHYRRYKLFTNRTIMRMPTGNHDMELLYVQILDEDGGESLTIFPLNRILSYRDPQPTTDRDGQLHVLFMNDSDMYNHVVVDADGAVKDTRFYKPTDTSNPHLMQGSDGLVSVKGGRHFDPVTEEQKARERAKEVRSTADRPPGLPPLKRK
jgi:hypothetical protein